MYVLHHSWGLGQSNSLTGHAVTLQVALTRQGLPEKALQAVRMVLAPAQLLQQRSAADFRQQVDPLHEESCLQVCLTLT